MEAADLPGEARTDLGSLIVRPRADGDRSARPARRHDLVAVRDLAGDFVVPAGSGARAARTLRAYNRLRPGRVRAARSVLAAAFTVGLGRIVAAPRSIVVPAEAESLLDHLAGVLGRPELCFAGTARARDGFVTPVLQLFGTDGTCVGFAKIGWDDVTRALIDTEADALERASVAGLRRVHVPDVVWHGRWHDLAVLLTAPMPATVRRLGARDRVRARALTEIAAIDGPVRSTRLRDSGYWQDAARTAAEAAVAGNTALADRFEQVDRAHGDVDLPFGRWHGDLVPWNLARDGSALHAWDWAYSAPGVPLGFDAVHFAYLPTVVLDGTPPDEASMLAAVNVSPVLTALGLDAPQRAAVVATHRLEQDLRDERARLQRAAATVTAASGAMSASTATAPRPTGAPGDERVHAVARGGALNLVGSIVYGATSFAFLAVVTNELGAVRAGPVIVAIAIFTVVSRFAELGASTGLVRLISRDRTLGAPERIAPTIFSAVAPVLVAGVLGAVVLAAAADGLASLFGGGGPTASVARLVRVLAPFLPIASVYTVLVQGSRGFGTMQPLVWIDKIGRGCALPLVAFAVLSRGGSATAVVLSWASVTAIACAVTGVVVWRLTRARTRGRHGPVHLDRREIVASFWSFSLPRAAGQSFDVAVLWLDTLLVAALIGPTAAGIYAAGTRFLLVGTFTAEAIQQAVAPKISSLLTLGRRGEAHAVIAQATTWQAAITWPVYLGVIAFSGALLGIFGPGYDRAEVALTLLSVGLLLAVLGGPSDAVILMSGRSRQSLVNSAVAFVVNLGGNLLLVPIWGIAAAGGVWAATLLVAAGLPALQARRSLGLTPWSPALGRTIAVAVATVGTACLGARIVLGDSLAGLALAVVLGGSSYLLLMYRLHASIQLDTLIAAVRGTRRISSEPPRLTWTPS